MAYSSTDFSFHPFISIISRKGFLPSRLAEMRFNVDGCAEKKATVLKPGARGTLTAELFAMLPKS
jgi:hypothetical protein